MTKRTINFRFSEKVHRRLEERAGVAGLTRTAFLEWLIMDPAGREEVVQRSSTAATERKSAPAVKQSRKSDLVISASEPVEGSMFGNEPEPELPPWEPPADDAPKEKKVIKTVKDAQQVAAALPTMKVDPAKIAAFNKEMASRRKKK